MRSSPKLFVVKYKVYNPVRTPILLLMKAALFLHLQSAETQVWSWSFDK